MAKILYSETDVVREAFDAHGVLSGERPRRIPTGFTAVDSVVGGLTKGDLVVFAARPNVGKTQALIHMALSARMAGHKIGFISLEDSPVVLGERIQHFYSGVRSLDVRRHGWANTGLKDTLTKTDAENTFFAFPEMGTIMDIGVCMSEMKDAGVSAVYIDYLQTIAPESSSDMRAEFSRILMVLKGYAKKFGVVVFLASQVRREQWSDRLGKYLHEPELNELAETSFIERKAELVFLAWKDANGHYCKLAKNKFSLDAPRFIVRLNERGMYDTEVITETK